MKNKKFLLAIILFACVVSFQLIELSADPEKIKPDEYIAVEHTIYEPFVKVYGDININSLWPKTKSWFSSGVDMYRLANINTTDRQKNFSGKAELVTQPQFITDGF